MSEPTRASASRYLPLIGVSSSWSVAAFVAFAAWILWARAAGQRPDTAPIVFLFLVPIAAGTGLLSAARRGELDLLLGAGISRHAIWLQAWIVAWAVPSTLAAGLFVLAGSGGGALGIARVIAVAAFTGGVAFWAGMVEPRYAAGASWLLLRIVFLLTPAGLGTLMQISRGASLPRPDAVVLAAALAPESLLEPRMPAALAIAAAAIGIAAFAGSRAHFSRAELGGKRS